MKIPLRLIYLVFVVMFAFPPFSVEAGEENVLTNDSIIEMIDMGLTEDVILSKIRASKCDFDTSSETLLNLMKRGVNTGILKAMIDEDAHPSKLCDGESSTEEASQKPSENVVEAKGDMVYVRGGCFNMGDIFKSGGPEESPVHEVCIDDFLIGRHEVTVGEFREFMEAEGYSNNVSDGGCYYHSGDKWIKDAEKKWDNVGYTQGNDHPVTCVSWFDAMAYINWKSIKDGVMYRLPTEAEWEYAARSGGKQYIYSWGHRMPSGNIADEAIKGTFPSWTYWEGYDDGYVYTAPVGSYEPNDLGIYDMTGNVWEWVSDWYSSGYYANSSVENPLGPELGNAKILRGGSWFNLHLDLRVTNRSWNNPKLRNFYNGFRLAASEE